MGKYYQSRKLHSRCVKSKLKNKNESNIEKWDIKIYRIIVNTETSHLSISYNETYIEDEFLF